MVITAWATSERRCPMDNIIYVTLENPSPFYQLEQNALLQKHSGITSRDILQSTWRPDLRYGCFPAGWSYSGVREIHSPGVPPAADAEQLWGWHHQGKASAAKRESPWAKRHKGLSTGQHEWFTFSLQISNNGLGTGSLTSFAYPSLMGQ